MENLINLFNQRGGYAARPDFAKPGNVLVTWVVGNRCLFRSISTNQEAWFLIAEVESV